LSFNVVLTICDSISGVTLGVRPERDASFSSAWVPPSAKRRRQSAT